MIINNVVLPGLSGKTGLSKFCLKLNIQKVLLPTVEHPGRKNTNLFIGRIMKYRKSLEPRKIRLKTF